MYIYIYICIYIYIYMYIYLICIHICIRTWCGRQKQTMVAPLTASARSGTARTWCGQGRDIFVNFRVNLV